MNTTIMAQIKQEDEVIDVESGDDPIIIWNQTVETLMKKSFNGQLLLEDIVRYYSRSLRNQLRFSKEKTLLREKIYTHLAFLNAQYMELNDFMNTSNYYELMEDVLAYYCTLEFDLLRLSFPNKSSESTRKNYMPDVQLSTKRICTVLTTYLGQREVHILHVLLKMKYSTMSQAGNEVRRQLYYYVLFGDMSNVVRTIASYCRNYIVFLQYMELVNKNCQTQVKDLFYKKFGDRQIIMNNPVLRRILTINCSEAVNMYRDVNSLKSTVVKKYFASLKELNQQTYPELHEIEYKQFQNVEEEELSRQIFGKSNMEQTLLITDSDPEEVFTIDDDDDVTIQNDVSIRLPGSDVKKYGNDVKIKSIETIPRRRKKKKGIMHKTRDNIPDAIIELDCDETDIKTPRENVNPSKPPTAASANIADTKSGLNNQSIVNTFKNTVRASKNRRSQLTLRNSCDTRDTGLYPNAPLSVNNNVTNFVKDECESLNNSDGSERCSTSGDKVGVRMKSNDLIQKRNKLKNGRINGAKFGSSQSIRQSSQNINSIEIIELDCDEPTAPLFSQEAIKTSPKRLKEECLSETSDCDNKHQVTVKNLLEMMGEDYMDFRRDVCERVPNPHPIDSNLNKIKPVCTEIDKENINVTKNNNNLVTTAEVPDQLEGLQKNICDRINDRLREDLYSKNAEMEQDYNMDKEQLAVFKEISEPHNETINNVPKNIDDDNMASTIKRITSISLEDSSKESPQVKNISSEIISDGKDDIDPETLKELNKHNFDNVSNFYDFLHSLKLGNLKGLVKEICPSKTDTDNQESQNQEAVVEPQVQSQNQETTELVPKGNLNSDNSKELPENQEIAEMVTQQSVESENEEIVVQLENHEELNEMQNTRSFRTLAERKQMPLQTDDSIDKQVVDQIEPLNPQQTLVEYINTYDVVTSENSVTIDDVQSNIIIEKTVTMDSSEVIDAGMEVEEQIENEINAPTLKIEELRLSEHSDAKLVYDNNETKVVEEAPDNIEEEAPQGSQPEAQNHKELTSELLDIFKKIEQVTRSRNDKMEAPATNGDASSSEEIFLKLIEVYKDKFDVKKSAEVVSSSLKAAPTISQEEVINSKENELDTESEIIQDVVEENLPEAAEEAVIVTSSVESEPSCQEKEINSEENVIQNEEFVLDGSNTLIIYNIVAKYEDVTHVPENDTNNYEDGIIVDENSDVISQNCSTCTQSPVPLHCLQSYGKLTPPSDEDTEENYIPQNEEINDDDKNIDDNLLNPNILLTPSGSEEKDESIAEDNAYYTEYYEGDIMNTSVNIDGTLQAIKTENVDITDNQIMGDIVYSPINLFEEECIDKDQNSIESKTDNQAKIGILQNVLISPTKKVLASVTPHYNLLNSPPDSIKREVATSPQKIMYTSKQMIDKKQIETNFDQIKSGQIDEFQDIQDSFSGPLRKINDTNAMIDKYDCDNYDLFNYETTNVKNAAEPSTKSTKLSVRFGGVKTTTFYDEPSTSGNYEERYSSRSNSPTSDESKIEMNDIQKPKIRSFVSTKSVPKNKTPLLRPAFNPLLFMDISAPYERLKRKLNMEEAPVPVKLKAVERSNNFFFRGVYCEANPLDEKLTKKRAVINLARVTEEELSENYYKTLPDRDLKNHHTKRRCIIRRIDVEREKLKETPVASPSRIPDSAEFFEKNPVTGTVDYSKIVCDDSSRFYDSDSNDTADDCIDIPPFHISSNFSTPEKALNLTKPPKIEEQIEFSNSPKFLSDPQQLEECLIEKNTEEPTTTDHSIKNLLTTKVTFLSDNSNFYTNNIENVPTSVVTSNLVNFYNESKPKTNTNIVPNHFVNKTQTDITNSINNQVRTEKYENETKNEEEELLKIDDTPCDLDMDLDVLKELNKCSLDDETKINNLLESLKPDKDTRLPFKKRRMSVSVKQQEVVQESKKEEISYPATPMISIAEVEALQNKCNFKTLAERKQLPPLPSVYPPTVPTTTIGQYTIGAYTTPNVAAYMPINYIPCTSYYTIPPVLLPYNNMPTYEAKSNVVPSKQVQQTSYKSTKKDSRTKKEKKNENYRVYK